MKLVTLVRVFSLTSFLVSCNFLNGQVLERSDMQADLQPVVSSIYNLDHSQAARTLQQLSSQYPSDPSIPLLRALNRFWQAELSRKHGQYHAYIYRQLEEAVDKNAAFETNPGAQKSYHFVEFMVYALEARLKYFEESDWGAVNAARKVLSHLDPVIELSASSPELSLIAGLYHYYSISYPRDKTYLKPFMAFFPEGSISKGLKELVYASEHENIGQAQALYYLTDIYQFESHEYLKAIESSGKLHQLFPGNTWFHADYIRALIRGRRLSQAKQECLAIVAAFEHVNRSAERPIYSTESRYTSQLMMRIYHYLGQIAYHGSGNIQEAKSFFNMSWKMIELSEMERNEYAAYTLFYQGLCEDKLGNRSQALEFYDQALDHPDASSIEEAVEACEDSPCTNWPIPR